MKGFDLKKYIFANITAFIGYIPVCLEIYYYFRPHTPIHRDDLVSDAYFIGVLTGICAQIILFTFILTLIEIIIRKFLKNNKFPDFKIKLNLPKYLSMTFNVIYTILFYFGILISSFLFVGAILIMMD